MNFMIINIERFAGINFIIAVILHPVLSCRLWIFWYCFSEIYASLISCDIAFWILNYIIIAVDIKIITNGIFIITSMLYIIAELTELHELTLIASFLFLLIVTVHTGKLKWFQLTSLLSEHKYTHTTTDSFKKYFVKWWFLNIQRFRL